MEGLGKNSLMPAQRGTVTGKTSGYISRAKKFVGTCLELVVFFFPPPVNSGLECKGL
jgi:hypothetical protein